MSQKVDSVFDEAALGEDAVAGTSAVEIFTERLSEQIDQEKVASIVEKQRIALARYEKTNEMLANCVALSASRFDGTRQELMTYTRQLGEMRRDLESIFRRVRLFKQSLASMYPDAFQSLTQRPPEKDDTTKENDEKEDESSESDTLAENFDRQQQAPIN